jgi:hypothetical protein
MWFGELESVVAVVCVAELESKVALMCVAQKYAENSR